MYECVCVCAFVFRCNSGPSVSLIQDKNSPKEIKVLPSTISRFFSGIKAAGRTASNAVDLG